MPEQTTVEQAVEHRPDAGRYVYAVLPASGVPEQELTGIDEAPVEYVALGGLVAATTAVALDRTFGRRADLLAHSKVVEQLARETSTVPVRFGSVLIDRDSVVSDLLGPSEPWFTEALAALEGVEQFSLRATYDRDQVLAEIVRADPRVADLRARTRDLPDGAMHPDLVALGEAVATAWEHKRVEESQALLSHVTPLVADLRVKPVSGDHVLDVALLVERTRRDELEAVLEDVAAAVHERIRIRLMGPLPPYDFVGDGPWV
ncbi:GvpL/GvpF family gas vesicle protein [Nocardioides guangzhouensis]|uniref:GvpL/GvpF family gas vesicle protein n=1 Tax=Nocardioides guangzhouensis TaxID=2497878 RepID=A0A4Q4Z7Y4_9ACTN|nr:GvpL/GvpF family gas vesicle protein [Nocardioides guangzhouensis]RYP83638.1 GvpL/GvpF family gas vesicle protein [Nocardioides guangzhouensis]